MFSKLQLPLSPNQQFDKLMTIFSNLTIKDPNYKLKAESILNEAHTLALTFTDDRSYPAIRFCSYYAAVLQNNINLKNWEELEETLERYFDCFKNLCTKHPDKLSKISAYGGMVHHGYSTLLDALRANEEKFKEVEARYNQACQFAPLKKAASAQSRAVEAKEPLPKFTAEPPSPPKPVAATPIITKSAKVKPLLLKRQSPRDASERNETPSQDRRSEFKFR